MPAARCTSALRLNLPLVAVAAVAFAFAFPRPYFGTTADAADDAPNVAGAWTWSWKDPEGQTHKHLMTVEGLGAKLAARELFDDLETVPVRNLRVDGKSIRFTVVRGDRRADYRGVVADRNTINGTVTITAKDQETEQPWTASRVEAKSADRP